MSSRTYTPPGVRPEERELIPFINPPVLPPTWYGKKPLAPHIKPGDPLTFQCLLALEPKADNDERLDAIWSVEHKLKAAPLLCMQLRNRLVFGHFRSAANTRIHFKTFDGPHYAIRFILSHLAAFYLVDKP